MLNLMLNNLAKFFCVCTFCFNIGDCQFPRRCVDRQSLTLRECCPLGIGFSRCSEAAGRGVCEKVKPESTNILLNETAKFLLDDRAGWPKAFYDRVCICTKNYDGVDCSKCKHGFEGNDCSKKAPLKVRKNLTSLTVSEVEKFIDIIDRSKRIISSNYVILTTSFDRILQGELPVFKNTSIYNIYVWMHYYVTRSNFVLGDEDFARLKNMGVITNGNRFEIADVLINKTTRLNIDANVDYAHEGPAFLSWHRYFMLKWETELREYVAFDPDFTLPYWDWRDKDRCDVCNDVMFGGRDADNDTLLSKRSVFSNWEIICTRGEEYMNQGRQCDGEPEGDILRNPGNYDPTKITGLPTSEQCNNILQLAEAYDMPNYDATAYQSYRNLLEGFADPRSGNPNVAMSFMHNAVHLFLNGTMSSVDTSANDPIFIVHHTFVDALFEIWLRRRDELNKEGLLPSSSGPRLGHRPQDYMVPFFPLVRNEEGQTKTQLFGYIYDFLSNEIEADLTEETSGNSSNEEGSSRLETDNNLVFDLQADVNDDVSDIFDVPFISPAKLILNLPEFDKKLLKKDRLEATDVIQNLTTSKSTQENQISDLKRKRHKRKKWRRREGNFILERHFPAVGKNDFGQLRSLFGKSADTQPNAPTSGKSILSQIETGFAETNQMFQNLSSTEAGWLIATCCLLVACSCLCICMCRSQVTTLKRKRNCCCCYDCTGESEESFLLLPPTDDESKKKKVVKGKLYFKY